MSLRAEKLSELYNSINHMIIFLNKHDLQNTARFMPYLKIISNNIKECISCNYDGFNILIKYIQEDWRKVCLGKDSMENWVLHVTELELKGNINKQFEELARKVDKQLEANYLVPKTWFCYEDIVNLSVSYDKIKESWDSLIEELKGSRRYFVSPDPNIPNDIWSFAKSICFIQNDIFLKEWFFKEIPAFGFYSPFEMLQIENGEKALKILMQSVSI